MKERLVAALAEALEMESDNINMEDQFRNYEKYSSLSELSVLAILDSDFGVEIEMKEYDKYKTVGDLLQLVTSRSSK